MRGYYPIILLTFDITVFYTGKKNSFSNEQEHTDSTYGCCVNYCHTKNAYYKERHVLTLIKKSLK